MSDTTTSTMKPCPFCGEPGHLQVDQWGGKPRYRAHCRNPACEAGCKFDSADEAAASWNRRSPVEAQPCAVAGLPEQLTHDVLTALECGCLWTADTEAEGRMRRVCDEFRRWAVASFAAPSAVLPLKGEVPKRCNCERAMVPAGKVCTRCGGAGTFVGEGAAAPSVPQPEAWLCGGSLFHSYAAIPGNLLPPVGSPVPLYARPLPGGVPTGLPTEAIEDAASVLRHIGPQLNAEWAHRCARAAAALSAGDPSSQEPTDAQMLDWLEAQSNGMPWLARQSTSGRGFRLHNDKGGLWATARYAIRAEMLKESPHG